MQNVKVTPGKFKHTNMMNYNMQQIPEGLVSGDASYRNLIQYESMIRKAKFDMVRRDRHKFALSQVMS